MAVMKLGAIVTDVAGSIGGTSLRRGRGLIVAYNKPRGPSIERLYNNRALIRNSALMHSWSNLTTSEVNSWVAAAGLFQFPDKFGDLRYLRPRELYIKLQTQLATTGAANYTNATGISSSVGNQDLYVPGFQADGGVFTNVTWEWNNNSISIDYYVMLAVIRVPPTQNFFPLNKQVALVIVGPETGAGGDVVDLVAEMNAAFDNVEPGQKFIFSQWIVNEWGFKSAPSVEGYIVDAV